jgi:hypothetical protein
MTEEKVCGNCGLLESDHRQDKCLYAPTRFKHWTCIRVMTHGYADDIAELCEGEIMGIHTPKLTDDEPSISWVCHNCGQRGERPL